MNKDRIMTDKQLMELHNDIRDGVTATITVKHLHDMENAIRDLLKEMHEFDTESEAEGVEWESWRAAMERAQKLVPDDRPPPPPDKDFDAADYPLKQEPGRISQKLPKSLARPDAFLGKDNEAYGIQSPED